MCRPFLCNLLAAALSILLPAAHLLCAQETSTPTPPATEAPAPAVASASAAPPMLPTSTQLVVPAGTRLPLILRNSINTRTAKRGDSVYFESVYPITANNRVAIPMGTFVRGEVLEAKRPGRIRGRGEVRMAIQQLTFPNGYTVDLLATPSSVDPNSGAGVNSAGTISGPSSSLRDTTAVLLTTAGGAYIGAVAGGVSNDAPGKGALVGGGVGGIGALIAVLATRGPEAELPRGTMMDVVFDRPLVLDAAYLPANAGPGIDPQPRYAAMQQEARDARLARREAQNRHSATPAFLPFLFLPLLR